MNDLRTFARSDVLEYIEQEGMRALAKRLHGKVYCDACKAERFNYRCYCYRKQ